MKKVLSLIMALLIVLSMVACGGGQGSGSGGGGDDKYNISGGNKVEINLSNPTGGVGQRWIEDLAEEYAKRNVDTDYGDGKKGVYIEITPEKGRYADSIKGTNTDILVQAHIYSGQIANTGDLYCLDEVYYDETRVGGSLETKIFDNLKPSLVTSDGHCYGLPVAEFYSGISYNAGLFEEIGAYFLLDQNGAGVSFYSSLTDRTYKMGTPTLQLSYGPDGAPGTVDDGLPASLEEFIALMEFVKSRGYYPMCLSGAHNYYSNYLFGGLMVALAGSEQMNNYYNSDGVVQVVELDATGNPVLTDEPIFAGVDYIKKPSTKPLVLTSDNGYMASTMVAKYYTTALIEIMRREGFFSLEASGETVSHYDAQLAFLAGEANGFSNSAMLIDASYWYNETIDVGNFVATKVSMAKTKEDFDIRFMPLPTSFYFDADKEPLQEPTPTVLNDEGGYELVVNSDVKNDASLEKAVIDFLKFIYAEEQIKSKTISTGMAMSVQVNMTEDELEQMDSFYRYLYKARAKDGSNILFNTSASTSFVKNKGNLRMGLSYNNYSNSYEKLGNTSTVAFFKDNIVPEIKWTK